MKQIHISIVDKVAAVLDTDVCIDCNSGEEYQLIFTLDSEWDQCKEKTVKLMCGGDFYNKEFVGNSCVVPTIRYSGCYALYLCGRHVHTEVPAMIDCIGVGGERPDEPVDPSEPWQPGGSGDCLIDPTLTKSGQAADAKVTGDKFVDLESDIADLLYKPVTITKFTNNVNTIEIGSTVTDVTLAWDFSKVPVAVTLDGIAQPVDSTGVSLTDLSITANKSWQLVATDERGAKATKSTGVTFLNGVYYGVATQPSAIDSSFIRSLTKTLRGSKLPSFTVNAGTGQYIYYCVPKRFGTCEFSVGGFSGGFELADTTSFTNVSGYTEDYYVYKSVNAGLGNTTVNVM